MHCRRSVKSPAGFLSNRTQQDVAPSSEYMNKKQLTLYMKVAGFTHNKELRCDCDEIDAFNRDALLSLENTFLDLCNDIEAQFVKGIICIYI